jgi:NADH:ubiquinone oxidoreductase subunit 3 (subunit A)
MGSENALSTSAYVSTTLFQIYADQPSTDPLKKAVVDFSSCAKTATEDRLSSLVLVSMVCMLLFVVFSVLFIVAFSVSVFYNSDVRSASLVTLVYLLVLIVVYYFVRYKVTTASSNLKEDLKTCFEPVSAELAAFQARETAVIKTAICPFDK